MKKLYTILGFLTRHTQANIPWDTCQTVKKVTNLAKAHQRQCENDCNGHGFIPRKGWFTTANPQGTPNSAYLNNEPSIEYTETVFDQEIAKIEDKIIKLLKTTCLSAEFQHDPRGATVRIIFTESGIENNLTEVLYI